MKTTDRLHKAKARSRFLHKQIGIIRQQAMRQAMEEFGITDQAYRQIATIYARIYNRKR
jgi:hypothetical protein